MSINCLLLTYSKNKERKEKKMRRIYFVLLDKVLAAGVFFLDFCGGLTDREYEYFERWAEVIERETT